MPSAAAGARFNGETGNQQLFTSPLIPETLPQLQDY